MTLSGRRVVLGVSGGIAAYKACTVARQLAEMGAAVDVVLTAAARQFVGPVTFEALTHRAVRTSLWDPEGALSHVKLTRDADLIILAPATAHLLGRAAQGLADDFLTAMLLASDSTVLAAPAMNDRMFQHPATQQNIAILKDRNWNFIGPDVGPLAEGDSDMPGRMSEPEQIVALAERLLRSTDSALAGRRVLVTAGPSREAIDPVRVITNRSSGRMGYALAASAFSRGADVVLVTGPTSISPPYGVNTVAVETTDELCGAVRSQLPESDVLVMAAAPADYAPDSSSTEKRPRSDGPVDLRLVPTSDILMVTRDARKPGSLAVGFALETVDGPTKARAKLTKKNLDLIVLNMANEPGAGFEVETNRVTLITADGETELPLLTKRNVAEAILNAVEGLL